LVNLDEKELIADYAAFDVQIIAIPGHRRTTPPFRR
jgi:hypothetical protein